MGVNSEFGIKTTVDTAGIDGLIARAQELLGHVKNLEKGWTSFSDSAAKASQKMSQSFVDADGKITKSSQERSDRQAELLTAQVAKQAAADAKRVAAEEAANAKTASKAQALSRAMEAYANDDAESVKRFAELKAQYEGKSVDEIRAKIHTMNEAVRQERVQLANTVRTLTQEGDKEAVAAAKNEYQTRINVDEKELQQFRLLEQEKVGRTFAEIQERIHAEGTGNKEILSMLETSAKKEEELQKQITVTFEAEEKKRLTSALNEAKQETAAIKQEAEKRNIEPPKKSKGEGGGISLPEVAMLGAATEGLSALVAKSDEVTKANKAMETSFGAGTEKAKEEAEEIGRAMGMTKDEAGTVMAQIHAATGAQGEDLKKYTQAYIAMKQSGLEISARSLQSQAGMQKLMTEGMPLVANAMKAAQEPAQQAALAQKDVEESAGELANTLLTTLAPALGLIPPILDFINPVLPELVIGLVALTLAMNAQAIAAKANAMWDNLQAVGKGILTAVTAVGTVAAAAWAVAVNAGIWPVLAVVAGVALLVAGIVLLIKHFKEVTDWVANAAGSLLHLVFGVNSAEAATKKHTAAVKDNTKSLADQKKAIEDATAASKDYTDELEKNQAAQKTSAEDGEKAAEAAIVDIKERLQTATGAQKAALEERLAQYTEYGARQTVLAKRQAQSEQDAKDSIGLGKPKKAKKKKKADEPENIAKAEEDRVLAVAKDADAKLDETDAQHKAAELKAEQVHADALLTIAKQYHAAASTVVANADMAALTAKKNFDALSQGEDQNSMVAVFQDALAKRVAMEKEAAALTEKMRVDAIQDESEKAMAEEHDRYAEELEKRKADIINADGTLNALGLALQANHEGKKLAIIKNAADKAKAIQDAQTAYMLGPVTQGFNKAIDTQVSGIEKTMGLQKKQNSAFGTMAAGMIQDYTKMGIAAIEHANISTIADDASAAGKWALAAANSVAKAFESIPFPLDLLAAAGSIAAVVALAAEAKHIGGHAAGTDSSPGGMKWVGEEGPELMNVPRGTQIIPNHHLPNLGQPAPDFTPLLHALNTSNHLAKQSNDTLSAIHSSSKPGYGSSQGLYNLTRGQQMATRIVNRRQVK